MSAEEAAEQVCMEVQGCSTYKDSTLRGAALIQQYGDERAKAERERLMKLIDRFEEAENMWQALRERIEGGGDDV